MIKLDHLTVTTFSFFIPHLSPALPTGQAGYRQAGF